MSQSVDAEEVSCPFCEIVRGEGSARVVMRTDETVAFFPLEPATLGHTLVVPRMHIPDIWSVPASTASSLAASTLLVARAVRKAVDPQGLNIIQSNGEAATQSVQHLHVHVVPRWSGDGMGWIWPDRSDLSEESKDTALERIQSALKLEGQ